MHATLDSQVTFFHQNLPPEGDLATKLYTSDKEHVEIEIVYTSDQNNVEIEIVYTSDQNNVEIEIVYTSGQTNVEIEKVYTSAQTHDFRTIKGQQLFAINFPNDDL